MASIRLLGTGAGAAGLLVASAAMAAEPATEHAHGHDHGHEASGATLGLNDGKKWQTDAPLRAGMEALRDELQPNVKAIHAKTFTAEQYAALAGKIEGRLVSIMSECKLPPDVDAQLHVLLVDFFDGAKVMKSEGDRMKGVVKIVRSLEAYDKHFDHPNWKPLAH